MKKLIFPVLLLLTGCGQNTPIKEEPAKKEAALFKGQPATVWMKQLADKDVSFRLEAVHALKEIGPESDEVVLSLLAVLKDKDRRVQEAAAEAFSAFPAEPTTPVLIEAAKNDDHHTRLSSIILLGKIGPKAKAALPLLKDAVQDDDRLVRSHALEALTAISPDDATSMLIFALGSKHDDIRDSAAVSLGKVGPKAQQAIPVLKTALKDSNADVRSHAAEALRKIEVRVWTVKAEKIQEKVEVTGTLDAPDKGEIRCPVSKTAVKEIAKVLDKVKKGQRLIELDTAGLNNEEKSRCLIDAPWDGEVDMVLVKQGENVEIGQSLLRLVNLDKMQVRAFLRRDQELLVQREQPALIHVEPDKDFKGKVAVIHPNYDPRPMNTSILVSISDPVKGLRPGMFARVVITVGNERTVLSIPASALDGDRRKCLVQGRDGGFEERQVVVGPASGEMVEVVSGLKEGEHVVRDFGGYFEWVK